jgi:hypothetical protein
MKNAPVKASTSKALADIGKGDVRFIQILKDDFKFDLIKEMIDHMGVVKRSKKLKPEIKHRMQQTYYLKLLEFCVPKLKVQEGSKDTGDKVNFTINIGGEEPAMKNAKPTGGVNITIPTTKKADGSFAVDKPKE